MGPVKSRGTGETTVEEPLADQLLDLETLYRSSLLTAADRERRVDGRAAFGDTQQIEHLHADLGVSRVRGMRGGETSETGEADRHNGHSESRSRAESFHDVVLQSCEARIASQFARREGRPHIVRLVLTSMVMTPTNGHSTTKGPNHMSLAQLQATAPFIADGGLETTLMFQHGIDLPAVAAVPLLDTTEGRSQLTDYYRPYLDLAERLGLGIVVDTPTWRASIDWGARLGYDPIRLASVNRHAVEFVAELAQQHPTATAVVNGVIGPRGDGYVVGSAMSPSEAAAFHGLQARSFAEAGADMISAIMMTYAEEAIGVTRAAAAVGLPVAISFTVETDGRLPSGQALGEAIATVDDSTHAAPAYFMINCAHPTHFLSTLDTDASWLTRVKGIRANASRLSHAELDAATELDRGDIGELAELYGAVRHKLDLRVVGGCCGTDHHHIAAIAEVLTALGAR